MKSHDSYQTLPDRQTFGGTWCRFGRVDAFRPEGHGLRLSSEETELPVEFYIASTNKFVGTHFLAY